MNQARFGKRLLKTGIAVFITAELCHLLNWPMIFAVISAIVSIEPTVHASIRKGIIRLPSAAIGAASAMIFDDFFGSQPITFTLSALATIYVCQLLRWNDSIVVATLTAVNMIPLTEAHFLINFLIRLGTTMTGIVVSALVNFFIFRPDYASELRASLQSVCACIMAHGRGKTEKQERPVDFRIMDASLRRIHTLLMFQISDYRYKRTSFSALREIAEARKTLGIIRRALFYMETAIRSKDADERIRCRDSLEAAVQQLGLSRFANPEGSRIIQVNKQSNFNA